MNGMGVMMNTRVILLSDDGHARQAYLNAIRTLGVQVDTVSSFRDLRKAMTHTPYHGVMIDLITKIKAPSDEKEIAYEMLEIFPVVQLKWEVQAGLIRTLYFGQSKGGRNIRGVYLQAVSLA